MEEIMVAFNWMEVEIMQGGKGKREGEMHGMEKFQQKRFRGEDSLAKILAGGPAWMKGVKRESQCRQRSALIREKWVPFDEMKRSYCVRSKKCWLTFLSQ